MDIDELMEVLKNAFGGLSGDQIARVFNDVVDTQVEYKGDSIWEYTEVKTTDEPVAESEEVRHGS